MKVNEDIKLSRPHNAFFLCLLGKGFKIKENRLKKDESLSKFATDITGLFPSMRSYDIVLTIRSRIVKLSFSVWFRKALLSLATNYIN